MLMAWTATLVLLNAAPRQLAVVDLASPPTMLGLAAQVTQTVQQEAQKQGYTVVPPDDVRRALGDKEYEELQQCEQRVACAEGKLRRLGVTRAVIGSLQRDDRNYLLRLWLLDFKTRSVVADVDRAILIAARRFPADVKDAVPRLLRGEREPTGTLKLSSNAKNAQATVDGVLAGTTPLTLTLKPGKHEVRLEKQGYFAVDRLVTVESDQTAEENVRLVKEPGAPPDRDEQPKVVAQTAPPEPPSASLPTPTWVALGVAVVGLGTGGYFGLSAARTEQGLKNGYDPATGIYQGTRAEALSGKQSALFANIGYGVGGAALIAAGVTWILAQPAEKPHVSISASPQGGAVWVQGSWQ